MDTRPLRLTPHETVTLISNGDGSLDVEATYSRGGGRPPRHWHPVQDEHFRVLSGTIQIELDGETRELRAGEIVEIPRGSSHRLWNEQDEDARVAWRTTPAGRTEQWFRAIDALYAEGRVGANGTPSILTLSVLLHEYRDVFRVTGPDVLFRPGFALMARIGRGRRVAPPATGPVRRNA